MESSLQGISLPQEGECASPPDSVTLRALRCHCQHSGTHRLSSSNVLLGAENLSSHYSHLSFTSLPRDTSAFTLIHVHARTHTVTCAGLTPPSQVAKNKGGSPGCRFHWALVSFSNVKSSPMASAVCREVRWVCSKEAAWARGRG